MKTLSEQLASVGLEARFGLDLLSVQRGLRDFGLLHVDYNVESDLVNIVHSQNMDVIAKRTLFRIRDPKSREQILLDQQRSGSTPCSEVWFARKGHVGPEATELFRRPGVYLGYPDCCVRGMEESHSLAGHYERYLWTDGNRHWELNRLATLFSAWLPFPDFFPCSLACNNALKFVAPFWVIAETVLGAAAAQRWSETAQQPLILWDGNLLSFKDWQLQGDALRVHLASVVRRPIAEICTKTKVPTTGGPYLLEFRHLRAVGRADSPQEIIWCSAAGGEVRTPLAIAGRPQ
jgi:hypothetical protein